MSRRFTKEPLKPPSTNLLEKMEPLPDLSGSIYFVQMPMAGNSAKVGEI